MKKISLIALLLSAFMQFAFAQQNLKWHTDMYEACKQSQQTGKPVMAYFEGSDWCGWCTKLNTFVLSKPNFAVWAQQNVVLLQVDFPKHTLLPNMLQYQNAALSDKTFFDIGGYPRILVFNPINFDEATKSIQIQHMGHCGYPVNAEGKEYSTFMDTLKKVVANKNGTGYDLKTYINPFLFRWKPLIGVWAHQKAENLYWMKVSFNYDKNQFEGVLVKQGNISQEVGFSLGELCWTAAPNSNKEDIGRAKPTIAIQQKWHTGSKGVSSSSVWKSDVLNAANFYSNLITTNSGMSFYKQDSAEVVKELNSSYVVLSTSVQIAVKFKSQITSDDNTQPQVVVANDIKDVDGRVLIAAGTSVKSEARKTSSQNNAGKGGKITVYFDGAQAVDGQLIQLSGKYTVEGKESIAGNFASFGGKALKGKEATIATETVFNEAVPLTSYKIKLINNK